MPKPIACCFDCSSQLPKLSCRHSAAIVILTENTMTTAQMITRASRHLISIKEPDLLQSRRNCDVPGLVQTDGSGGCRRQVDVSTSNPRTAVVDANYDASAMANANLSAEWKPAMSGCHCRTIQSFSAGGPVATKTVATAIYARYFRMRSISQKKQHNRNDAAQTNQPLHAELPVQLPRQSLDQQKLWHKLDQQRSEIRQANEAVELQ